MEKLGAAVWCVTPWLKLWPMAIGGMILAAFVFLFLGGKIAGFRDLLMTRAGGERIQSIAVLPLENLSRDAAQDYLADGMTDEVITSLARISSLRVISRTSSMLYKGTKKPLPQIARELNVGVVLEGTLRRSGSRVRLAGPVNSSPAREASVGREL